MSTQHRDDYRAALRDGFELGVLGWSTAGTLERFLVDPAGVRLTGVHRSTGGVWLWLGETRFFFAYPSSDWPPLGARLVAVEPLGASVTLRFRKGRRTHVWVGDALRSGPAEPF